MVTVVFFNFLQSCVDSCHSSAALLDHFCFLWRPFLVIMQIMSNTPDGFAPPLNGGVGHHGMMPTVLSTGASGGKKKRGYRWIPLWFAVTGIRLYSGRVELAVAVFDVAMVVGELNS